MSTSKCMQMIFTLKVFACLAIFNKPFYKDMFSHFEGFLKTGNDGNLGKLCT